MSKQHPESPLFNHRNCKEIINRKICAIVRKDKKRLRKLPKSAKEVRSDLKLIRVRGQIYCDSNVISDSIDLTTKYWIFEGPDFHGTYYWKE